MELRKALPTKQIIIPVVVTALLICIWEAAVDTGVIANFTSQPTSGFERDDSR